jgi:hypothetical protein
MTVHLRVSVRRDLAIETPEFDVRRARAFLPGDLFAPSR